MSKMLQVAEPAHVVGGTPTTAGLRHRPTRAGREFEGIKLWIVDALPNPQEEDRYFFSGNACVVRR